METEATEAPVILYETLAPLGEGYDDQTLGPPSYCLPLEDSTTETVDDRVAIVANSALISAEVVSTSTSFVSLSVDEKVIGRVEDGATASSAFLSQDRPETDAVHDQEQVTTTSKKYTQILEVVENENFLDLLPRRDDDEEIGFLSFEPEDSADASLQEKVLLTEEQKLTLLDSSQWAPKEAPPWARTGVTHGTWFRSPFLQLHQEIVDFCNFVTPTEKEQKLRDDAVQRVREVVLSIWPSCQVKVFGSFATGLYLPTSDVDVVILESGCQVPQDGLKALAKALNRRNLVKNLQVIGKARVPIVKFVEAHSNIPFDISFDVANGPEAADFIKDAMTNLPPLKPLCMVLKIFLQQRELNEVYTGGIGSYALLVMLLTHLQMHPSRKNVNNRGEPCPLESNLGVLLVDFFDFYGRALNVRDVGISCRSGGRFFCKRSRGFADNGRPYLLSVEDPQKPDNDIGKNSYNVTKVRSAFVLAHRLLTKLEVEDVPQHVGLLGRIVRMDTELTGREVVLPELPQRVHSAKKSVANATSSGHFKEQEPFTSGVSGRSRWQEDEDFPRGGEVDENLSRKRKRAKDRAERFGLQEDPLGSPSITRNQKRKRSDLSMVDEAGVSPIVNGRKSKHRKDLEMVEPASNIRESRKPVRERLGPIVSPVDRPKGNGRGSKQPKGPKQDYVDLVDDVEEQSPHDKRSSRRSRRHRREESHEEGEITLDDDAIFAVGNGREQEHGDEVTLGAGNGQNKHKRWFNEAKSRTNRLKREQKSFDKEQQGIQVTPNESGRGHRKVVVTNAHKKITYL